MKKFTGLWLFSGILVLLSTTPVFAKNDPWELKLPFEKAVIHYEISGSQTGTETLYIRDFGNERVKITKQKEYYQLTLGTSENEFLKKLQQQLYFTVLWTRIYSKM